MTAATSDKTYTGVSHRCSLCSMQIEVGVEPIIKRDIENLDGKTFRLQYDHADTDDCVGRLERVRMWNASAKMRVMHGEVIER